ncbi:MAG TPA: alpha/beta hydrolase [Candidatus Saccharimonadales bacterium]|nr:alpha/beta hydrolase [Candidatus Saccharimonadales bacterium]
MSKQTKNPADYIETLYMNGLHGRMLFLPSSTKKKREILLVYGHHASLERMFGLAEEFSKYGNVTMPDLPGFGGMQSFYKIKEKPTLDNLADYLAAFIKLRFKRKRLTIMGMSFGFLVATRMLQVYPELVDKVDLLISIVGFAHKDDFRFKRRNYLLMRYTSSFFSNYLPSKFVQHFIMRGPIIRKVYQLQADSHSKLKDADKVEQQRRIDFEIVLWQINDVRTYMDTTITMFTIDLCKSQVDLPLHHIEVKHDRYLNNRIVEQHLKVIYSQVDIIKTSLEAHAPTVIADAKDAAPFVPTKLRRLLAKS